ncbi:MFS transporter [Micromonospora sp. NPDC005806]|uniref:MFS transporter n=1 Tax=Micromonospora sp. NPDC005806 TaxID=3364234 RepID=UPI0036A5A708
MTNVAAPRLLPDTPGRHTRAWWGVSSLSLAILALVTTEFLPASLLSPMSADLDVSAGTMGQIVTATALVGAIAGPTLAPLLPRADRKRVLIILMMVAIASNVVSALAPSFIVLVIARLALGASIAGFWGMALAVVAVLVPKDTIGRAMTLVTLGGTVATVAAVPVGAYLGELLNWRVVFLLAAVLALIALAVQWFALPQVPPAPSQGFTVVMETLRRPVVAIPLFAVVLIAFGHFAGFTYIRLAIDTLPGATGEAVPLLLFVFGVAGVLGNMLVGWLVDTHLRLVGALAPLLIAASLAGMVLLGLSVVSVAVPITIWGAAWGMFPTIANSWVARVAPDRLESVGALTVTMFQVGITLGAIGGGLLVDNVDVDAALTTGAVAAVAGGLVLVSRRPVQQTSHR